MARPPFETIAKVLQSPSADALGSKFFLPFPQFSASCADAPDFGHCGLCSGVRRYRSGLQGFMESGAQAEDGRAKPTVTEVRSISAGRRELWENEVIYRAQSVAAGD